MHATLLTAATALVLSVLTTAQSPDGLSSAKRGLVYVPSEQGHTEDDNIWDAPDSDLTWYYNYEPTPSGDFDHSKLSFVPMLWGSDDSDGFADTVRSLVDDQGMNITWVLAFNEPDGCVAGGSCVPADTAAEIWKAEIEPLKEQGIKLGAPGVTGAPTGHEWLESFFTACDGGCSADFIPIHWYGNFEGLASHVGQVNASYPNMTMWVTEYAYADGDLEESQEFYNQSADFFDRIDYITHYSYFGSFRSDVSNVGPNAAMLTEDGELTDIGAWYLGQEATGNEPSGAAQVVKFTGWVAVVFAVAVVGGM